MFKDVDRLGWIMLATPGNPHGQLSYAEFGELRQHARAFDTVAAQGRQPLALTTDGRVEQVWALFVSGDYFRALDTRAAIGRVIDASDASRDDLAALVSHEFWRTRLNGESIAGRTDHHRQPHRDRRRRAPRRLTGSRTACSRPTCGSRSNARMPSASRAGC